MGKDVQQIIDILIPALKPEQIFLFGSRARDQASADSDWDLFVVLPDHTKPENMALNHIHHLLRDVTLPADIVPCRRSRFEERKQWLGTISYVVAHEGICIYEQ